MKPRKSRRPDKKLTIEMVEGFAPEEKHYEVPDPGCAGLYLRVSPKGAKTWAFRYSIGGQTARVSLGTFPTVTIDQARAEAKELGGKVAKHEDPAATLKREKSSTLTLAKLWERYEEEALPALRESTRKSYRYTVQRWVLPVLGRIRLQDIGVAQVAGLKSNLKRHKRTANYCIAILSSMLAWAESEGIRPPGANPCGAVPRFPLGPKQQFLDTAAIKRLGQCLDVLEYGTTDREGIDLKIQALPAAAIRLLLLTGARHSEILHLKWSQVAGGKAVQKEHKTMARGDRLIYFPEEARAILEGIPHDRLSPYVFAGGGKDGTIGSSLSHAWELVRDCAMLPGVRMHDLRHTFASIGVASGLTLEQVGQLLGHGSQATTQRYAHLVDEAARANVEKVAGAMKKAPFGA